MEKTSFLVSRYTYGIMARWSELAGVGKILLARINHYKYEESGPGYRIICKAITRYKSPSFHYYKFPAVADFCSSPPDRSNGRQ